MKLKDEQKMDNIIEKNIRRITKFLSHYPPSTLNLILYKAIHPAKALFSPEYMSIKNVKGEEEKIRLIVGDYLVHAFFCDSGKEFILEI